MQLKQFLKKYRYYLYILYVPIYFIFFMLIENYIDGSNGYFVSYLPIDDVIPFVDWFLIFYYAWYGFMVFVGLWLLIKEKPAYERFMFMIMIGFTFSLVFFLILPNGQDLRPTELGDGFFSRLVAGLYKTDTNTNVLPSMHCYGSLVTMFACIDSETIKSKFLKTIYFILGVLICASTVLLKQHSMLDFIGAIVEFIPLYLFIYRKRIFDYNYNVQYVKQHNKKVKVSKKLLDVKE